MTAPLWFPHSEIRLIQQEYAGDVAHALGEKKVLLAHAPTGLGKTAAALAPAVQYAQENNKVVFFLTNRHTQHLIAIETLKQMKERHQLKLSAVDLIGKKNMCNHDVEQIPSYDFNEFCRTVVERKECSYYLNFKNGSQLTPQAKRLVDQLRRQGVLHNQELIAIGRNEQICSYEVAAQLAEKADVVIADYHHLFNPFIQQKILGRLQRDLSDIIIIVDEAHNLPGRVTDLLSQTLTTTTLTFAAQEARKNGYYNISDWLDQLTGQIQQLGNGTTEKMIGREILIPLITQWKDYDETVEELQDIADDIRKRQKKSFIGGVAGFLSQWPQEQPGLIRFISQKTGKYGPVTIVNYSCLDPSIITANIFEQCHSALLMSGTLRPLSFYREILGMSNVTEKEYRSPFPAENKLSIVIPETTTKFTARSSGMYQSIAGKCQEINETIPGNMAFFFPSYDLLQQIRPFFDSGRKRLFTEKQEFSKEEKEQFLVEFKDQQERSGGVLFAVAGANFAEGVDFPGKMLNGVVVVGLPLSTPDLKTRETIKYYDQKYGKGWEYGYVFPALNKCFQSAGRCIRSAEDRGVIIYLDERFTQQQYFQWFDKENLLVTKNWKPLVEEFFRREKLA